MLTDQQRLQIREELIANEDTWAGESWQGQDVNELTDEELVSYAGFLKLMTPVHNGLACQCGRTHVFNRQKESWDVTGTPKASKLPASVEEYLKMGGGTPEDKEQHEFLQNEFRQRKADMLEQIVANMNLETEQEREEAWNDYKNLSLAQLQKMAKRVVRNNVNGNGVGPGGAPVTLNFGAQGAPPQSSTQPIPGGVAPLASPVLDFSNARGGKKTG